MDLPAERIEIHREPTADGYRTVDIVGRDGTVSPLAFPDVELSVDDILG